MNNNFYEIPNDWYNEFDNTFINSINNIPVYKETSLVNPKEGMERGNLFNNLYSSYQNYNYRGLRASNRREKLLFDIMIHNFALTDLDLYLDTNPTDIRLLNLYGKYLNNKNNLVSEYEKNFGPLTLDGLNIGSDNFNWVKDAWPWEVYR